jgi:methylglutaconyl-CoA hydratase
MMHEYSTISVQMDGRGVVSLCLSRAEKKNALSAVMIDELTHFASNLPNGARVVVLSGAGDVFCAGGDLGWMKAQISANRETRVSEARKLAMMLNALNELDAPLIGRVHGGAFGGGIGLCCVCDSVIAEHDTKFGLTETRLGLIPATISPYVIARMGEGRARRVFMSARIFAADEACQLGIVSGVETSDGLDARIEAEIAPYLSVAPNAVSASKRLARALGPQITPEIIDMTIQSLADTWEGEEAAHGISAFLGKSKARWMS